MRRNCGPTERRDSKGLQGQKKKKFGGPKDIHPTNLGIFSVLIHVVISAQKIVLGNSRVLVNIF